MKSALFALCLVAAGCASSTFDTSWPDPRGGGERPAPPQQHERDVVLERRGGEDAVASAAASAASCAQYGRVAVRNGDRIECVTPDQHQGPNRSGGLWAE